MRPAPLEEGEIDLIARLLAASVEVKTVTRTVVRAPASVRIVRERVRTMQTVMRTRRVDGGPNPTCWAVLGVGTLAAVAVFAATQAVVALVAIEALSIGACVILATTWRTTREAEVPVEEEIEQIVPREVETPAETEEVTEEVVELGRVPRRFARLSSRCLALPAGGRSLLVDVTGACPETRLEVPDLPRHEEFAAALEALERLTAAVPMLLDGNGAKTPHPAGMKTADAAGAEALAGEERELATALGSLAETADERRALAVALPIVGPGHPLLPLLSPREAPGELDAGRRAVAERALDLLERCSASGRNLVPRVEAALARFEARRHVLDAVRFLSLRGDVAPLCQQLGEIFHYSAFNFYCEPCNRERNAELLARDYSLEGGRENPPLIYSSNTRLQRDVVADSWRCPQCQRQALDPIPMHRILDELLLPAYDRLMEENKNVRLGVYAETRKQQREHRNGLAQESESVKRHARETLDSTESSIQQLRAEITGEEAGIEKLQAILQAGSARAARALASVQEFYQRTRAESAALGALAETGVRRAIDEIRYETNVKMVTLAQAQAIENRKRDELQQRLVAGVERTANATESSAQSLQRIDVSTARSAQSLERIDASTARSADSLERIDSSTARTANATEASAAGIGEMVGLQKRGNAISRAVAERQGVSFAPSGYDPIERVGYWWEGMKSSVLNENDVDRAARFEGQK